MSVADLHDHLATGLTRVCQCWALERSDGVTFGFTDHDQALSFEGITFQAESGLSAKALASSTGVSVNNTEAVGVLQSDVISEADIEAGRYDDAQVTNWLVQWDNVAARQIRFRGTLGNITRQNGMFEADLRGLTDRLNQPQGRSYLKTSPADLAGLAPDGSIADPAFAVETPLVQIEGGTRLKLAVSAYADGWFSHGVLQVMSGLSAGLTIAIKSDRLGAGLREVTLWQTLGAALSAGDVVRLVAGHDGRAESYKAIFGTLEAFRGFPHIPGDDWMMSVPRSDGSATGGSLQG